MVVQYQRLMSDRQKWGRAATDPHPPPTVSKSTATATATFNKSQYIAPPPHTTSRHAALNFPRRSLFGSDVNLSVNTGLV